MKVFVCSIAKNEEQFVKRWADSCKGADGIFMLDTGSTDNTVELARSLGVTVYEQSFNPWRFDVARNHLLDLLPEEDAWLIWLDLDEILTGDWLTGLSNVPEEHNRVRYNYIWSWNADGSPGKSYAGDKIVRRFSHRWKHPVHEVNVSVTGEESQFYSPSFEIYHHPDHSKSRSQ
jgi:glycosyltransferase involved in cell wall biosynthesis